jgi:hypothetical protein
MMIYWGAAAEAMPRLGGEVVVIEGVGEKDLLYGIVIPLPPSPPYSCTQRAHIPDRQPDRRTSARLPRRMRNGSSRTCSPLLNIYIYIYEDI